MEQHSFVRGSRVTRFSLLSKGFLWCLGLLPLVACDAGRSGAVFDYSRPAPDYNGNFRRLLVLYDLGGRLARDDIEADFISTIVSAFRRCGIAAETLRSSNPAKRIVGEESVLRIIRGDRHLDPAHGDPPLINYTYSVTLTDNPADREVWQAQFTPVFRFSPNSALGLIVGDFSGDYGSRTAADLVDRMMRDGVLQSCR